MMAEGMPGNGKDLGYGPVYDLPEGMAETVAWYRENGYL
jgi:nucleoside-diphosphate-sugar epimerase